MAEIEESLRAEVSKVCRYYCFQVWNEALNQVGVEAFFSLRRAESMYYPPALCASGSLSSKDDTASKGAEQGKPKQSSPSSQHPFQGSRVA